MKRIAFQIPLWAFMVVGSAIITLVACTEPGPKPQVVGGAEPTEPQSLPGRNAVTAVPTRPAVESDTATPRPTFTLRPPLTPSSTPPTPSRTPLPTVTPTPALSTPAPLAHSVLTSCPVSLPNLTESPDAHYISTESGYGNPERTMFIGLWPGGKVYFCRNCAGSFFADGSLSMKFWFYRTIPGEVVIEGRKLDEPGPVAHLATLRGPADGYGETGFHPAALLFPDQGCWEVTARIGEAQMTFVTLVVWIPFDRQRPGWLPENTLYESVDLSGYPHTIGFVYQTADGGQVILEMSQGPLEEADLATTQEPIMVNGEPGVCFQGKDNGKDAGALAWASGGLYYRIRYAGLRLTCPELLSMAPPPESVP